MKIFLRRAFCAGCLTLAAVAVHAQGTWPTKPVRLMVPSAAGSAPDIIARIIGDKLTVMWGHSVVVENKPGAGGLIALTSVKMAREDGHGFVFAPAAVYTVSPYVYKSDRVDVVRDFVPVAMIGVGPMMAAVSVTSPAETLADVVAMARKNPGEFVVATPSQYTLPHLAVETLSRTAGVPLRPVPYANSGQSIAAVVSGDAQMLIDGVPAIDPMIKGKRLKPIAVFSEGRLPDRPQLPSANETYPSLVFNGWFGVVALQGTDAKTIERVNRDINSVIAMPDVVAKLQSLAVYPRAMTPTEFGAYWSSERMRWEKVLRDIGAPVAQ